jgi:outer membrane protein assembly factor BamB
MAILLPRMVRPAALRLSFLGLVLALGACAHSTTAKPSDSGTAPGNSTATTTAAPIGGYAVKDADFLELGYRRDWTAFPFVSKSGHVQKILASGDLVLVLETGSTVTALESTNGAIRWANELATPLTRFVGLTRQADRVLVSADSDLFFLSALNGSIMNRQTYRKVVNTAPVLFRRECVYGTTTGHVLAHQIDLGVSRWMFLLRGAIDHPPVIVAQDGNDAVIGCVSQSGEYVFVGATNGKPLGRGRIFSGIDTDPIAAQSMMIVAGRDQSLWALNIDGSVAWRVRCDLELKRQPTTDGKTVWCQLGTEGVSAVDVATGKVLWSNRVVEGSVIGERAGNLLVWNGSLALLLDKERGDIIRSFVVPQTIMLLTDKFEDGNLYALSDNGVVVKFVPRS